MVVRPLQTLLLTTYYLLLTTVRLVRNGRSALIVLITYYLLLTGEVHHCQPRVKLEISTCYLLLLLRRAAYYFLLPTGCLLLPTRR